MLTRSILFAVALTSFVSAASAAPNYQIVLNGSVHDVELDKEYKVPLAEGGENVSFTVRVKEDQTFSDSFLSFSYKKKFSLTESGIHEGVNQVLLNSALGTIVIVQEYSTVNPSGLTSFFLNELTSEERAAGFTQTTKPYEKKLSDTLTLKGIEAVVEKGEQKIQYIVAAHGTDKTGILIAVRLDQEFSKSDGELIENFWNTLSIKLGSSTGSEEPKS